jgi:pimeloyl-ACP methyl ester carboxylesterase
MATHPPLGDFLEIEPGAEIYYEDTGTGSPILFVPGWTFTTEVYRHQISHFSSSHRVVALDPRSQGRSSITLHGNNYLTHAADLSKLIARLDLKDVVLVGWSFGCLETWGYLKLAGTSSVKAIVSIDLSPKPLSVNPDDWVEGPLDEIASTYNSSFNDPQGHRDFITTYAKEVMFQHPPSEAELFWIAGQSMRTPYYVAAALFASGMFADNMAEAKLADESVPALNIIAEHWADRAVAFTRRHFPKTRTAVLGGHMMFWEYPAKFNTILEDFIGRL